MAVEDSVAQDQLKAFISRIERMEEEKAAIAADIKEIYAEAKGNGFDTKILRKIVTIRKQDANERMEQEALLEMYMSALGMVEAHEASLDAALRRGTNRHSAPLSFGRVEAITKPQPTKAAGQAARVSASLRASSVENEAAEISTPITEQQASPKPASDLTSSQAPQGEVATHEPDAQTDGAGDFEREVAQSVPAHLTAGDIVADGLNRAAEFHEPDATPAGAVVANRSGVTGGESAATPSRADRIKALRPLCQRPEACGSSGGKKHCHSCTTAAERQEQHA